MTGQVDFRNNAKTLEAIDRLKRRGFSEAWCQGLLERIADLPRQHAKATAETSDEALERRSSLAARMEELAREIASDPEAREYFPGIDIKVPYWHIRAPFDGALGLDGWLIEAAETLRRESDKPLANRRNAQFRPFVVRSIALCLEHYQAIGLKLGIVSTSRALNVEAALLASALLEDEITPNYVTQARRSNRRRYPQQ